MNENQFAYLKARLDATQTILDVIEMHVKDSLDEKQQKWILEAKKTMLETILSLPKQREN